MNKEKPVRVLQIGMTQVVGGLETYLMQQFRHLDRNKIIYDFVNNQSENTMAFQEEIRAVGSHVYNIHSRRSNPIRHYWEWYHLMRHVSSNYNAVVLNVPGLTYIFPLLIAKWFGIPMRIIHSHNSGYERKIDIVRKILIFINRRLLKYCATQYFACSRLAGTWMFGKDTPVTVIHNAIETDNFIFDPGKRDGIRKQMKVEKAFVIGHVARFSYQKNHIFLIDIFKAFHDRHPNSILWLIGGAVDDGSIFRQVKEKVHEFHLDGAVQFLGMRKDVADLYQAMDCFVLPSHFEGLPIVVIEAQAAGLSCVLSENITREVKITDLVKFASIGNPKDWIEKLEETREFSREDTS